VQHEISISIRDLDASIEGAYRALFPTDADKSSELLKWRSRLNPHGPTRFAVASRGEEIVGMVALIRTQLRNAPETAIGYQAVDTAVHPSCRGKGLFVKLGNCVQQPGALDAEIVWGFPNSSASPGWYGRLGWTNFGPVPLLMRPLRSRFLFGRLHPKLAGIDVPLIRQRQSNAKVYADGAELSADFDQLWQRVAPEFGVAVDRSGEWMRWRLFDKPDADYRCVGMKSDTGELDAFVAVKLADKHRGRLCYIMEAIAAPGRSAELARILLAELSLAARQGAEVALAWCPKTAPNNSAYRKAGFLAVPPRLRPIEINFGARALVPQAAEVAAPGAAWYVSFLDSDTN
jgi:hypothetical protein